MALTWDYTRVSPAGAALIDSAWVGEKGEERNPALDFVVWGMMGIGMGQITAETLPEVQRRFAIYQHTLDAGCAVRDMDGRKGVLSADELALLVGFSCNVSTLTKTAFNKRMIEHIEREAGQRAAWHAQSGGLGAFGLCADLETKRKAKAEKPYALEGCMIGDSGSEGWQEHSLYATRAEADAMLKSAQVADVRDSVARAWRVTGPEAEQANAS